MVNLNANKNPGPGYYTPQIHKSLQNFKSNQIQCFNTKVERFST